MERDFDSFASYASPPCFAHELQYSEYGVATPRVEAAEVYAWRRAERERLIRYRLALAPGERSALDSGIIDEIQQWIEPVPGMVVGLYWPYRGEPNLLPLLPAWHQLGAQIGLPVVPAPGQPLVYREWTPTCRVARGALGIPVPQDGEELVPEVLIVPLVGFDALCFRLGHGGGYFDRTLAAMSPRPLSIGVGHRSLQLPTIYPLQHDIPMDLVVTGRGESLERVPLPSPRHLRRGA